MGYNTEETYTLTIRDDYAGSVLDARQVFADHFDQAHEDGEFDDWPDGTGIVTAFGYGKRSYEIGPELEMERLAQLFDGTVDVATEDGFLIRHRLRDGHMTTHDGQIVYPTDH